MGLAKLVVKLEIMLIDCLREDRLRLGWDGVYYSVAPLLVTYGLSKCRKGRGRGLDSWAPCCPKSPPSAVAFPSNGYL